MLGNSLNLSLRCMVQTHSQSLWLCCKDRLGCALCEKERERKTCHYMYIVKYQEKLYHVNDRQLINYLNWMDMSFGSVVGLFLIQLSFGKMRKSALYRTEICLLGCSQNKRFCFILDWIKYLGWLECFIWFSEYPLAFKIQVNSETKHLWVGWFF